MKSLAMGKKLLTSVLVGLVVASAITQTVLAQNCGCAPNLCCSQHGYCGQGNDYCGTGCKEGPCFSKSPTGASVASIISPQFFNGIISQARADCAGKKFYTRQAFLTALDSFPDFGKMGSDVESKREIAAFFAHATHETEFFCHTEEQDKSDSHCDTTKPEFPCAPGKSYYGRGPLQLSWNYNYGKAGNALKLDLLKNPEMVANDPVVSFKGSLWYWMAAVRPVIGRGFGETIKAINGRVECGVTAAKDRAQHRIQFYTDYCKRFGVDPGPNLSC
ncbi:hypothetical protein GOBAR_AA18934 [Gossypium barbadense]|uniref:chitinase n=1 Tax=Gossypium barbadense TaxID=3634 RepID=A0A2P5XEG8_GOSBA|nr:hypothetical protein GOBAR_AA18934 [Gossypium barbadense]